MIRIKRVYEKPAKADGERLLVDRLWPRGVRKQDLKIKAWLRETGPSNALRHWFGHDPVKWPEFKNRYFRELRQNPDAWRPVADAAQKGPVTLLFSAKDEEHNNAVALKEFLEDHS